MPTRARKGGKPKKPSAKGRKHVHWREDPVILERLVQVERLNARRLRKVEIARELGVDESTIRYDLKRLTELWLDRIETTQDELRGEILSELDEIGRQAIEAAKWDLECERAVLTGGKLDGKAVKRDKKGSAQFRGNKAAALGVARQAAMDKAKLLGVVVDKVAETDAKGNDLDLATLAARARENRARRLAEQAK